jgi:hypothetical protein
MNAQELEGIPQILMAALMHGAQTYANGIGAEAPIVSRHFTAGNQGRYGWEPLTRDYFLRKQQSIKPKTRGGVFHPGKGKKGVKLDPLAGFKDVGATVTGLGTGKNAPMLVLTGALRASVAGKKHSVTIVPGGVRIVFAGLPEYATYLHLGMSQPVRSPVEPGSADEIEIQAAIRRYLDNALKTGGAVAQSPTTVPGKARFV